MWNIAHRGASGYAPENTRVAFDLAIEMGATAIETDVRLTTDGELILFHDHTVNRVTDGEGPIDDYSMAELRALIVGEPTGDDLDRQRILTVAEALDDYARRRPLVLEIKEARATGPLVQTLRERGLLPDVTVTSFMWHPLLEARAMAPELVLGYLTPEFSADTMRRCQRRGLQQVCPHVSQLTGARVLAAHDLGLAVRVWGIDQRFQIDRLFETGTDGATVNWPDWIAAHPDG